MSTTTDHQAPTAEEPVLSTFPTMTDDEWIADFREYTGNSWMIDPHIPGIVAWLQSQYTLEQAQQITDRSVLRDVWLKAVEHVGGHYSNNSDADGYVTAWLESIIERWAEDQPSNPPGGWKAFIEKRIFHADGPSSSAKAILKRDIKTLIRKWRDESFDYPTTPYYALEQAKQVSQEHNNNTGDRYNRYDSDSFGCIALFLFYAVVPFARDGVVVPEMLTDTEAREALDADFPSQVGQANRYVVTFVREVMRTVVYEQRTLDDIDAVARAFSATVRNQYGSISEEYYRALATTLGPILAYRMDSGEHITDFDALREHLVGAYGTAGEFTKACIANGVLDLRDAWRCGEVDPAGAVDYLRKAVMAYGEGRFAGGGRRTLGGALERIMTDPQPLDAEEWAARYARLTTKVGAVAGRYGEVQNMCPTLEKAVAECAIPFTRAADRDIVLRDPVSGMKVAVKVETWRNDEASLRVAAQTLWASLTPEQQAEAIIEQGKPVPRWESLTL